jgi:hypothetical protein
LNHKILYKQSKFLAHEIGTAHGKSFEVLFREPFQFRERIFEESNNKARSFQGISIRPRRLTAEAISDIAGNVSFREGRRRRCCRITGLGWRKMAR